MSKKIRFLLSFFIMANQSFAIENVCSPVFWRDNPVFDKFALLEDFLSSSSLPGYVTYENVRSDICIREEADVAKVQAVCFSSRDDLPYCDFQKNTFLHLAAQFVDSRATIDELIDEGFDLLALNSNGKTVEDYAELNPHGNFIDHLWEESVDEFLKNAVASTTPQLTEPDWELDYEVPALEDPDDFERRITIPREEESPPPERPAPRSRYTQAPSRLSYTMPNQERQGLYASVGVGMLTNHSIEMTSLDNDVPGSCVTASIENPVPFYYCVRGQNRWENLFSSDGGLSLGAALGYKTGNVSFEVEISHRDQSGSTSDIDFHTDRSLEFQNAEETLGGIEVQTKMVNIYKEFDDVSEKIIPFVGIGGGTVSQRYDYGARLIRIQDRDVLQFFNRGPESAHKATQEQETYTSSGLGFQFMGGFKIPVNEGKSEMFLKARYLSLPEVQSQSTWDVLRSAGESYTPVTRRKVEYIQTIEKRSIIDIMFGFNLYLGGR